MGGCASSCPTPRSAFIVAWLAIAGVPPFAGLLVEGRDPRPAFFDDDYGVWIVGLVAAVFTGFYMTRAGLPHLLRQRAVRQPEPTPARRAAASEPTSRRPSRQRPVARPCRTATPVRGPAVTHPPHESPWIMSLPILALAVLAAVGGLLNLPFESVEFLTTGSSRRSAASPTIDATSFVAGFDARGRVASCSRSIGIGVAYALYRRGLGRRRDDPLDERLGAVAACSATPTTTTRHRRKLVGGPGRGFAELARPRSSTRDHRRRRQRRRGLVRTPGRGLRQRPDRPGAQLRARHRARRRRPARSTSSVAGRADA